MGALPDPRADRLDDRWMGVAGHRDAVAAVEVDVLGAVDVVDLRACAMAEPDRLWRAICQFEVAPPARCRPARSMSSRLRGCRLRNSALCASMNSSSEIGRVLLAALVVTSCPYHGLQIQAAIRLTDRSVYATVRMLGQHLEGCGGSMDVGWVTAYRSMRRGHRFRRAWRELRSCRSVTCAATAAAAAASTGCAPGRVLVVDRDRCRPVAVGL